MVILTSDTCPVTWLTTSISGTRERLPRLSNLNLTLLSLRGSQLRATMGTPSAFSLTIERFDGSDYLLVEPQDEGVPAEGGPMGSGPRCLHLSLMPLRPPLKPSSHAVPANAGAAAQHNAPPLPNPAATTHNTLRSNESGSAVKIRPWPYFTCMSATASRSSSPLR